MEATQTQTQTQTELFDVFKLAAWAKKNQKALILGGIAAVVIGGALGAYFGFQRYQESQANQQLFALPPVFGAKDNAAPKAADLLSIGKKYSGTSAGEQAMLLGASRLFTEGKYAEAQKEFSSFLTEYSRSPLAAQAAVGVAASLEGQGKIDEAIQKYQDAIKTYANDGVVSPVKLTLARLYEGKNNSEQAFRYFDDLSKSPNPYDPWASEARERKELLLAKHPELSKLVPPPVSTTPGVSVVPQSGGKPQVAAPQAKPAAPAATPSSSTQPKAK